MLLLDLPIELLAAIAAQLAFPRDQAALAALCSTQSLLRTICTPLLERHPVIETTEAMLQLGRTAEREWKAKGADERVQVDSLSLCNARPYPLQPYDPSRGYLGQAGWATLSPSSGVSHLVGSLRPHISPHLRRLTLHDIFTPASVLADLLGPFRPWRTTIEELTLERLGGEEERAMQFIFCHLLFNHTSAVYYDDDFATEAEKRAAALDFELFENVEIDAEWTEETERLYLASPVAEFPFSSLHTLNLSVASETGDELFLVFWTGLFPVLKYFRLRGRFEAWLMMESERFMLRRSLHRPPPLRPSTFLPPLFTGRLLPPGEMANLWLPLSAAEIKSPSFTDYRGPQLIELDLSELTLHLVE